MKDPSSHISNIITPNLASKSFTLVDHTQFYVPTVVVGFSSLICWVLGNSFCSSVLLICQPFLSQCLKDGSLGAHSHLIKKSRGATMNVCVGCRDRPFLFSQTLPFLPQHSIREEARTQTLVHGTPTSTKQHS